MRSKLNTFEQVLGVPVLELLDCGFVQRVHVKGAGALYREAGPSTGCNP